MKHAPQRVRGRRPVLALVTLSAAALVAGGLAAATAGAAASAGARRLAPLLVRTDSGLVRGMDKGAAREFLGLPYAAPPVGRLRWRPPQPARPWTGIRDATSFGNLCAQVGAPETLVPVTSTTENCLYLNIYGPAAASARRLPVMVWIPGGAFAGGAGSVYDGAPLAVSGNVIVVTINYRVGPFGFLSLPSLDAQAPGGVSGDYGLEDQQAALRWVQRNAAAFGGDPHNVTIFGQSAGGVSVCDNMASPTASGLFQRAIAESGCLEGDLSQQTAQQHGAAFAAALGCTDAATAAACLRAKPASVLLTAAGGQNPIGLWGPVTGGSVLPLTPATAFADGRYSRVPLLQGSNHDEGRFFVGFDFDAKGAPLAAAQYPAVLADLFGATAAARVLTQYPLSAYPSPDLALSSVITDSEFSCPALQADDLASASRVYGYEFDDPGAPDYLGVTFSFPLASAHGSELQYVFGKVPRLDITPPFTAAQFALSAQMMGYWTRFAATGNPNPEGVPAAPYWPAFSPSGQQIQELTPGGTAPQASFAAEHQCAFWQALSAAAG